MYFETADGVKVTVFNHKRNHVNKCSTQYVSVGTVYILDSSPSDRTNKQYTKEACLRRRRPPPRETHAVAAAAAAAVMLVPVVLLVIDIEGVAAVAAIATIAGADAAAQVVVALLRLHDRYGGAEAKQARRLLSAVGRHAPPRHGGL